jgi:cold shock CspA family protein
MSISDEVKALEVKAPELKVSKAKIKYIGKVVRWDAAKNFGFAEFERGSIFLHRKQILPDADGFQNLILGETIVFEIGFYNEKPCATFIERMGVQS